MHRHCVKSVQIRSFLWSAFSRIWTEYGEILCISPYLVRMRENTDQKKLRIWILFTQCWVQWVTFRNSQSRGVFIKKCSKICCKFTAEHLLSKCDFNKVALQIYFAIKLLCKFSCKYAAFFQNTFSEEHLSTAAFDYCFWNI